MPRDFWGHSSGCPKTIASGTWAEFGGLKQLKFRLSRVLQKNSPGRLSPVHLWGSWGSRPGLSGPRANHQAQRKARGKCPKKSISVQIAEMDPVRCDSTHAPSTQQAEKRQASSSSALSSKNDSDNDSSIEIHQVATNTRTAPFRLNMAEACGLSWVVPFQLDENRLSKAAESPRAWSKVQNVRSRKQAPAMPHSPKQTSQCLPTHHGTRQPS